MSGDNIEAQKLSQYLIGKPCPAHVQADYYLALEKMGTDFTERQSIIWYKMVNSRFMLRAIDSGLAFTSPSSQLRKRIYIMLCLLEASKENTDSFLPVKRGFFYLVPLSLRVFRAGAMAAIGILIIKLHGID